MEPTWVVVADQSQAQLFCVRGPRVRPTLEAVETLTHARAPLAFEAASSGTHLSLADPSGPMAEEERRFIRKLVSRLRRGQRDGAFSRLYVAAPANFVGHIRGLYGTALAHTVRREIIGDYTHTTMRDLQRRVRNWLD